MLYKILADSFKLYKDTKNARNPVKVSVSKDILIKPKDDSCKEVTDKGSVNGWFWANILGGLSGILSSTTDASSGAMWKYDENVTLDCK